MGAPNQAIRAGTALSMYGDLLPEEVIYRPKDFYCYVVQFVLTAGGTTTTNFTIDADADFLLTSLTGRVYVTGTPETAVASPGLLVTVTDSGSGRNLQSAAFSWSSLIGTGELPSYLPYPKLLARAGTISTQVQNLVAGTAYTARLVFGGFKIFGPPLPRAGM